MASMAERGSLKEARTATLWPGSPGAQGEAKLVVLTATPKSTFCRLDRKSN